MDDWGALEKHCGLAVTVGSNPTLSAKQHKPDVFKASGFFMDASLQLWGNGRVTILGDNFIQCGG